MTEKRFPDNFKFGIASSAYQIEGGHDADGKGPSIWDHHFTKNPDMPNGNTACDSFHKYKEDVSLLKDLCVDFYRFSMSWSRILPGGYSNKVNPSGITYYKNLIAELHSKGVEPMVTLYHWDLPQRMQEIGGWANPLIVDYFEDYARVVFENFGDQVKLWISISTSEQGYGDRNMPPFLDHPGIVNYLYIKHAILAHARVHKLYHSKFEREEGKVGLVVDGRWYEPLNGEDEEAAERALEFVVGIFFNPIYSPEGDFPEVVRQRVDALSKAEGFSRSRLPHFTKDESAAVKDACDFLGFNMYTAFMVKAIEKTVPESSRPEPSIEKDMGVEISQDDSWARSGSSWLRVVPWMPRKILNWVKNKYGNPLVYITECGFSDGGQIEDSDRIEYLKAYLNNILDAVKKDGVRVERFAAWSLLDNFEWMEGYRERFGLYHVDFTDPNRKRTAKSSALWYKNVIRSRCIENK